MVPYIFDSSRLAYYVLQADAGDWRTTGTQTGRHLRLAGKLVAIGAEAALIFWLGWCN